jgi:hypothetical protein
MISNMAVNEIYFLGFKVSVDYVGLVAVLVMTQVFQDRMPW